MKFTPKITPNFKKLGFFFELHFKGTIIFYQLFL